MKHEGQDEAVSSLLRKYSEKVWIKSAIQAFPYLGPLIDNILSSPGHKFQQSRIERFIEEIGRTSRFLGRAHPMTEFVSSEEGYFLFMNITEKVRREYHRDKVSYYHNIFSSYLWFRGVKGELSSFLPEKYIQIVDRYHPHHFRLIWDLDEAFDHYRGVHGPGVRGDYFEQFWVKKLPGAHVTWILRDLHNDELISVKWAETPHDFRIHNLSWVSPGLQWNTFAQYVLSDLETLVSGKKPMNPYAGAGQGTEGETDPDFEKETGDA